MARLTGGQAIIDGLEREGVDVVFGIPGVHTLDLYDALVDSDIEHVTTRHEQGAGFMADGYARATGRVGIALVITGPGLTNVATPIGQAYSDSSPVLVISSHNQSDQADQGRGLLHELKDQHGVMESIAAYSERVDRVADVPGAIADAFDYFDTRRPRPIHLELPMDVLARTDRIEPVERAAATPPAADDERIDAAVDRLEEATAPLLIVGGGATDAAASARRLVETTGMPVISTVAGKGVIPDTHELSLGATLRRDEVADYAASRDLVLAVGTELSPMDTGSADLPENLIHVDIDYGNFGKNYPVDLGIVADAETALPELVRRVEERGVAFDEDLRDEVAAVRGASLDEAAAEGSEAHRLLATLRDALDENAIVVNDMTMVCYEATRVFPVDEPGTFLFPRGFGTLGFSPPAAFGAAIGATDRQVVSLVGDGGFLFTVQELATAVKYDIGIPVIVLNDDSYEAVRDNQVRDYDGRLIGVDIDNPDFIEMARSFGAAARRIEYETVEDELPAALDAAFARDRPTVVEIPVDF